MRDPTFVFVLSLALATTATLASPDPVWSVYGRPHRIVEIGNGRHLNLFCLGTGSPTVILDGGLGADMSQWRQVHADLARTTRVCAYDRAGNGFSDPGPLPRTAAVLAADLDSLLHAAHLAPPYVLVGSSLAGLHTRLFADTHPKQVVGMVLVDPSFEHQTARYEAATPSFKLFAEQQVATLSSCIEALRAGMPAPGSKAYKECIGESEPDLPPEVTSALAAQTTSDSYRMVLSELHEFDGASSDQIDASRRSYGDMPLIVLTAGGVATPDADAVTRMKIWIGMHDQMAALSSRGINRIVPNASHHIMLSRPEAVIAAVDEVVAAARESAPRPNGPSTAAPIPQLLEKSRKGAEGFVLIRDSHSVNLSMRHKIDRYAAGADPLTDPDGSTDCIFLRRCGTHAHSSCPMCPRTVKILQVSVLTNESDPLQTAMHGTNLARYGSRPANSPPDKNATIGNSDGDFV